MSNVLFICQANVGRSQTAEAYYNYFTKSKDASSAGNLKDASNRYPRLPPQITLLMREEGIDMTGKKPKLVTPEMIDLCDKMYILCKPEECLDFVISSAKPKEFWNIKDPYNISIDERREIRDQIKEKVLSII
jgi:arsenate reductase